VYWSTVRLNAVTSVFPALYERSNWGKPRTLLPWPHRQLLDWLVAVGGRLFVGFAFCFRDNWAIYGKSVGKTLPRFG
jgi:hypothetical protein